MLIHQETVHLRDEITRLSGDKARELFIENPLKVYNNELIEVVMPIEVQKSGFFKSLFSKFKR